MTTLKVLQRLIITVISIHYGYGFKRIIKNSNKWINSQENIMATSKMNECKYIGS